MSEPEPTAGQVPATTEDAKATLLAQLRELLPSAFLDGELDKPALLAALDLDDASLPAFAFTWPGIEQARQDARAPTTTTLVPDPAASVNWDTAKDVLIEGDNLQVLKLLKNGYTGAFKLIYIDPPYNTGDTFTYNDDFAAKEADYLRDTGQADEQGATTSKKETKGRKHAPWLTMMFPRLVAARHLLRKDGVFLASIDNNEVHHLRLLLDAVFGAENFVDMMTWQGGRKGDAKLTAGGQDYVLIYAKNRKQLKNLDVRWRERKTGLEPVYAKEAELLQKHGNDFEAAKVELRAWYEELPEGNPAKQHSHYDRIDDGGVWTSDNSSSPNYRENLIYDFNGHPPPENGWRYELARMEQLDREGRLIYPSGRATRIRIKKYLHEQERWAPASTFYRDRSGASSALNTLMGADVFDDPKSTDVLARLVHAITGDGDLVLDFFAGSGSTGHAVWEQNPRDEKTRHWVLVQRPETPDSTTETGRNAVAAGYGTIFEITAERLRRAAAQLGDELGFRVFRTRETGLAIEAPVVAKAGETEGAQLAMMLAEAAKPPVKEGADTAALAWEVALKASDAALTATLATYEVDGATIYEFKNAEDQRLLVCLDRFTMAAAEAIGLRETGDDTLILRGDQVDDALTLTLAPRLRSKLIMLERMAREVSI
ncbi:site-specific DNA-methyltransferase [Pseudoxanthomonas mexicana]|uniref:site-specific DNA-methyltransferase n=1 Tax=Pseudoxanthomonas mexicana TaxID=128785 RepID=UPI0009F85A6E|nr:site-specific DNA-methyltransferase [Pseudoxanthomonas mexicana]